MSKNGHFQKFFFLGNIGQEKVFYDILETKKKPPFQAIKTRTSESRNMDIFSKGLAHGFGPNMAIFPPFFPIKRFCPKMAIRPNFFFQAIQARKMSFTIFQNEKKLFQAIKTRSSKGRNIDIFSKGLNHGFGPKMAIFPPFFLGNIRYKNVFYDFLERKNVFLGYKNKNLKKVEKYNIFPKGLDPKMAIFETFFFFQAIQAGKMSFTISYNEKTPFQAIKTRSSKSGKIDIFPNGLTHGFGPKMAIYRTFFLGTIA